MSTPTIERYMCHDPITIDQSEPVSRARRLMQTHQIRHLPVVRDGKLVGIVSQRDIYHFDANPEIDPSRVSVTEAMTPKPYAVGPEALIRDVAAEMASRRCGAVVIVDQRQHVLGLLTAVDGLRALSAVLSEPPSHRA
jgi:acetoin utilization protein AcuB